jgi:hypothetical protein
MSSSPLDNLKNMFSSSSEESSGFLSSARQGMMGDNGIYIGLFLVVVICLVVAYVLYYFITTKLFMNIRQVISETKIPIICTEKRRFDFEIKKTGNGERRSYTFWIYIHDMNRFSGSYKNVFNVQSSSSETNPSSASPFVFLDKKDNRMYVRFTKMTTSSGTALVDEITQFNELSSERRLKTFMKQGIVIPYIPLQRWVHVAIVCNANSYKNYIYAYIDGDLVSTTSHNEKDNYFGNDADSRKDLQNMNINKGGVINIGGELSSNEGPGFSGLVSKISTFNYELNQRDVYNDYYWGPVGNLLAKLGLGMYGIRNPIYKL